MAVSVEDFVSVKAKCDELGVAHPKGLGLLPRNLESAGAADDLFFAHGTPTVEKLWRLKGIAYERAEDTARRAPRKVEEGIEWLGPAILISVAYASQNPAILNLALGVVANYLTDLFRSRKREEAIAKLDLVLEWPGGQCRRLHYEGPADGLQELADIAEEMVARRGETSDT